MRIPARIITSFLVMVGGLAIHMLLLWIVDRQVSHFPSVPDLFMDRLPMIEFGWMGELAFFVLIMFFIVSFVRYQWRALPKLMVLIGIFYAVRGLFLFFLPIGSPNGAILPEDRFILYGFPNHAYFPGGHAGLLTLFALSLYRPWHRWILFGGMIIFGLGTILAKTHYTADILGGMLLGYAVYAWGKEHVSGRNFGEKNNVLK